MTPRDLSRRNDPPASATASPAVLAFRGVEKRYDQGGGRARTVLAGLDLELEPGRTVALIGRSGSGKSTVLNLAAGIDVATAGTVELAGRDLATLSEAQRTLLRRRHVGLVFQFFHLLPHLSVADNVLLPGWIAGSPPGEITARCTELLRRVDLLDRRHDRTGQLSGGEMQRVALCRALLLRPRLVLADEPTGSLDETNGQAVMQLLLELTRSEGGTLLYVTHSRELAALADRVWRLHGGRLEPFAEGAA
jgi:ABC-type lipoprotein export system ATPase subunit